MMSKGVESVVCELSPFFGCHTGEVKLPRTRAILKKRLGCGVFTELSVFTEELIELYLFWFFSVKTLGLR